MKKNISFFTLTIICILTAALVSSCSKTIPMTSSTAVRSDTISKEDNETIFSKTANSETASKENNVEVSSETSLTDTSSVVLSEEKLKKYQEIQDAEDNGHRPGLLDPEQVAMEFASDTLKITNLSEYDKEVSNKSDGSATLTFKKNGKPVVEIELYQPIKKGTDGIWVVISWTDSEKNTKHTVE